MKMQDVPKIERPTLPFRSFTRRRGEKLITKGAQNLKDN